MNNNGNERIGAAAQAATSMRIIIFTVLVCCVLYTLIVYAIGRTLAPHSAEGSLVTNADGKVVGSELIAQKFTRPEYFHPRPSASDYNAAGTAGSNLSPAGEKIRERTIGIIGEWEATDANLLPADLATASGGGLDPHITLNAARYQAPGVAKARGIPVEEVLGLLDRHAMKTGQIFAPEPVVNVLLVNMALDMEAK
jgi:K+-transporting ATPase ATPase C chain